MNRRTVTALGRYVLRSGRGRLVDWRTVGEDDYIAAVEDARDGRTHLFHTPRDTRHWFESFECGVCERPVVGICSRCNRLHAYWHSDSDALIAARAALWQATAQRDETLIEHIKAYLGNSRILAEALRSINAAAEEGPKSAAAARRLWPTMMDTTLDAAAKNPKLFADRHWGDYALSDLIPNPAYTSGYLTLELSADPIRWRDLLACSDQVGRWLMVATGRKSIDALVVAVGELEPADQVEVGLQWIEQIVRGSGEECANTYTLPEWLHECREHLYTPEQQARWQRVVDLLVIAGDRRVADLAD